MAVVEGVDMLEAVVLALSILTAALVWIIKLERRLTKIETNLGWIKKEMAKCLQS